jgi:alpha-ketoglutarate-dependent 2,4-dichlorophenoxyacetate dioxygenase
MGFDDLTEAERATMRPVRQAPVRTHEGSGRRALYLGSHIGTIIGWPVPEARAFIRDLTEHATQRRFVYAHHWRPFDLVMWDNRALMHRVRRYDSTQVRDMRRTTVAGTTLTAAQVAAAQATE